MVQRAARELEVGGEFPKENKHIYTHALRLVLHLPTFDSHLHSVLFITKQGSSLHSCFPRQIVSSSLTSRLYHDPTFFFIKPEINIFSKYIQYTV